MKRLEEMFDSYSRGIYNFLLLKTRGNRDVADDLLSETFLSAHKSLSGLKHNQNLNSWLIKIAHRRFIDYQRKQAREQKILQTLEPPKKDSKEWDDEIQDKKKTVLLNLAIKNLKHTYAQILQMKYYEGLSINEIAEKTDKTASSVQNIMFRAKEALKKEIRKISRGYGRD